MTRSVVALSLLAVAVGCTGASGGPIAVPTVGPPDSSPFAPALPPSPVVLPTLTLRADLWEPPAAWEPVVFIPFGQREEELGYKTFPETVASQPSAFAVAPDGSFWIDDRWKQRLAHYSPSGSFLGAATGLDPRGWDVAIVGGQTFVLVEQATGTLGTVNDGVIQEIDITYRGTPLFMFQLIPTVLGLVAQAGLIPGAKPGEFQAFVTLNPPGAEAGEVLPGLPVGRGDVFFNAQASETPTRSRGDQDFDLTFSSTEIAQTRPIHFELIAHDGGKARRVPAIVELLEPLVSGDDVLTYVQVSPTRPDDAARYGGGRWLLRVGRSPLLWERLPSPDMTDELHHRHLAIGLDGTIYLMVTKRDGMLISRRPSAPAG